jgi:hypothetical protein
MTGVDQGEVHQARRVVARVPARPGIELLRVHASELAEETNRSQSWRARSGRQARAGEAAELVIVEDRPGDADEKETARQLAAAGKGA